MKKNDLTDCVWKDEACPPNCEVTSLADCLEIRKMKESGLIVEVPIYHFCQRCGDLTLITDYDYKDGHLYLSLKEIGLCEDCARSNI